MAGNKMIHTDQAAKIPILLHHVYLLSEQLGRHSKLVIEPDPNELHNLMIHWESYDDHRNDDPSSIPRPERKVYSGPRLRELLQTILEDQSKELNEINEQKAS